MAKLKPQKRAAFTIAEVMVALVAIAVAGAVVVQCVVFALREQASLRAQQAAEELAANILEAARAKSWEQLDKGWAAAQAVPADMKILLPEGKVTVSVEVWKPLPQARRLTVEVSWQFDPELPPRSVQLTTILSGRSAKQAGGEP